MFTERKIVSGRTAGIGMVWAICFSLSACHPQGTAVSGADRARSESVVVRDVRVLLVDGAERCRIRVTGPFVIPSSGGPPILESSGIDWTELSTGSTGIRFGDRVLGTGPFVIAPRRGGSIEISKRTGRGWGPARRYAGTLRLSMRGGKKLRVINDVDVETYVGCVLPGELFPGFHPEAYRAQAVAARTYVLYQMADRAHKPYDVVATEMSQVYPGLREGKVAEKARRAAESTRGVVATWGELGSERIFRTYYSSCCGGVTQSAANCKKDAPRIPPLRGGVPCDCKSVVDKFEWPPTRISKRDVTDRLAARYPKLKTLGMIVDVRAVERTDDGRLKILELVGARGRRRIVAEDFRLAVGSRILRSTQCSVGVDRDHIVFTRGRGFGHGMGMCQWGMEAMAVSGRRAGEILQHYYPDVHLTRSY